MCACARFSWPGNSVNPTSTTGGVGQPQTFVNQVRNCFIGQDRTGAASPNLGDGVRIDGGAANNVIGGTTPTVKLSSVVNVPTPNTIANNSGHGVLVSGNSSTGNSILYNSITANAALGIATVAGGNFEIPPPVQLTYDGFTLSGTVSDINLVPVGSLVQVFADSDLFSPEGSQFLGEGIVKVGGAWTVHTAARPIGSQITMTSTHAVNRSTSQFGTATAVLSGFYASQSGPTSPQNARAGSAQLPILRFSLGTLNAEVVASSVRLQLTGTLSMTNVTASPFIATWMAMALPAAETLF